MRSGLGAGCEAVTGEFAPAIIIRGRGLLGCGVVALHIIYAGRYVECFTGTPCSEKLVTIHTKYRYIYASEKTSTLVFFTFLRLNSPRITTEKRGTSVKKKKTLKWERSIEHAFH